MQSEREHFPIQRPPARMENAIQSAAMLSFRGLIHPPPPLSHPLGIYTGILPHQEGITNE